jgi:hypothetical protein
VWCVPEVSIAEVVDLVNEYADTPRQVAGESGHAYPGLPWLPPNVGDGVSDDGLAPVVTVANAAFHVFRLAEAGDEIHAALNAVLDDARPWPRALGHRQEWAVRRPMQRLPAAVGLALLGWATTRGPERLGLCRADRCSDVFADASPAGRRRFCSAVCLNRHKVRAHRLRATGR